MNKRKWHYVSKPTTFGIRCDLCHGENISWSEFEHMIWCHDCQKDTCGTGGIFDGPILIETCKMLGIVFDIYDMETNRVIPFLDGDKESDEWGKVVGT